MNKRGQGALEYLLLIGGAVLVAAIVIALVTGTTAGVPDPKKQAACAAHANFRECLKDTTNGCVAMYNDGTFFVPGDSGCDPNAANEPYVYCRTRVDTTGGQIVGFGSSTASCPETQ